MFTKTQLFDMNYDKKYSSFGWIKNIEKTCDDNKLFKLYATNKSSLSGREYIPLPADKILTASDYLKYNIMK